MQVTGVEDLSSSLAAKLRHTTPERCSRQLLLLS
jgi:hypothetical protein